MNSFFHAKSSAGKWGGKPEDYQPIHDFIDSSKRIIGDVRHRAIYHHTEGTFLCERIFGVTIKNSAGKDIPVRLIAERHIIEDLGWLPTPADYLKELPIAAWMGGAQRKEVALSHLLGPKTPVAPVPAVCDCAERGHLLHAMNCPVNPNALVDDTRERGSDPDVPPLRVRDRPGFGDMILDRPHRRT